jgi:hypothetical protein
VQQDPVVGGHRRLALVKQLPDRRRGVEDRGQVRVPHAVQGGDDQRGRPRGPVRRLRAPGEREREPGDVAQPHLGVEQPLVQSGGAPARRHRGRAELRVDQQGGLVQPEQVPLEPPLRAAVAFGFARTAGGFVQLGQLARQGPGTRPVGALQPAHGGLRPGREEREVHRERPRRADQDLRGEPAEVRQGNVILDEEPEERAHEGEHAAHEPVRPEPPAVGARREHHGQQGERRQPDVHRQSDREQGEQRQRQEEEEPELSPRAAEHADAEPAHHRQDRPEHHRDHEQGMVQRPQLRRRGRRRFRGDRHLEGTGGADEHPLGHEDNPDRDHDLQGHPQPQLPRIGRVEPVEPGRPPARGRRRGLFVVRMRVSARPQGVRRHRRPQRTLSILFSLHSANI